MFKARKKKQHLYEAVVEDHTMINLSQKQLDFNLLNDVQLSNDFRSSIIIPELNKDLDLTQQEHLALLQDQSISVPKPPIMTNISRDPEAPSYDGAKQYRDLAAWRQNRRHRHSNGLFGGKQRNKPKSTKRHKERYVEERNHHQTEEHIAHNDKPTIEHNFIQENYEPDSDTEENFFFQDFSMDSKSPKPRKKNMARNKKSTNPSSRFDLSSFAKDLHDNRLSIIQRESKIVMTEQDELELQKLLELQRQRMSMMYPELDNESIESFQVIPPLPSLEMLKSHQPTKMEKEIQTSTLNSDQDSVTTTSASTNESICDNYMLDDTLKAFSEVEEEEEKQQFSSKDEEPRQMEELVTQEEAPIKEAPNKQCPENDSKKIAVDDGQDINVPQSNATLEPINALDAAASDPTESDNMTEWLSKVALAKNNRLEQPEQSSRVPKNSNVQHSMDPVGRINNDRELNNMADSVLSNPDKPVATSLFFLNEEYINPVTNLEANHKVQQSSKDASNNHKVSRSLFGSLRQANKSHNGGNGFKGLVRNFSTKEFSKLPKSQKETIGMSRAAMAVIQHNVAKQEKDQAFRNIFEESEETQQDKRRKSDNSNPLVQLLTRASSSTRVKKSNATKVVNMNTDNKDNRAEVVRKTIIYVQPDSLQRYLNNGGQSEDIPALPSIRNTITSETSSSFDDDMSGSKEYAVATKVTRQTSIRKRLVDTQQSDISVQRKGSEKKRFQLHNMDERESQIEQLHPRNDYMEGVELREMSDGTVIWGIVKKEGNRKSFYAPNMNKPNRHTSTNGSLHRLDSVKKIANTTIINPPTSKAVLISTADGSLSAPPIPRRSPRRRNTSKKVDQPKETETSIYYSDKVTLPNLLKMMQGHDQYLGDMMDGEVEIEEGSDFAFDEAAMSSVDDQLDSFMRDLLHQQLEQEQKQKRHF
ncbi:hypothetical protein BD560DRAFT_443076 [Blakeslea trispora]|nr:hypothetical protein BD560DRAFT_443076 [Blakeslea trispora]